MKHVIPKLRPVVKIHGGKYYLCRKILEHVPDDAILFAVPFGGAGSVLLNSQPGPVNIYCDVDEQMVNLLHAVKFNFNKLLPALRTVEYRENVFEQWRDARGSTMCPLDRALRTYIVHRSGQGRAKEPRTEVLWMNFGEDGVRI